MKGTFLDDRITKTKELIAAYEDALAALATGIQSYTLDTGQSRQVVTKFNIKSMQSTIDSLYNRLAVLETRKDGCGTTNARPAW